MIQNFISELLGTFPNKEDDGHDHDWKDIGEEIGSLGEGGCYDIYQCRLCGKIEYSEVPD